MGRHRGRPKEWGTGCIVALARFAGLLAAVAVLAGYAAGWLR